MDYFPIGPNFKAFPIQNLKTFRNFKTFSNVSMLNAELTEILFRKLHALKRYLRKTTGDHFDPP